VLTVVTIWLTTAARLSSSAMRVASAIQVMQVNVEGCFALIVTIGVVIAVYVMTRWD
jgi:hypothetical protein